MPLSFFTRTCYQQHIWNFLIPKQAIQIVVPNPLHYFLKNFTYIKMFSLTCLQLHISTINTLCTVVQDTTFAVNTIKLNTCTTGIPTSEIKIIISEDTALYVLQLIWIIEEVGSSSSALDFSLEGAWFTSWPRHQLIWLWFFVIFLSPSVQMSWIVRDCFHSYPFQFTVTVKR